MSEQKANTPATEGRQRNIYLAERIKELRAEMNSLQAQRKDVLEKLKSVADAQSTEAKELKRRRVYLATRPVDLKKELTAAVQERKDLTAKARA